MKMLLIVLSSLMFSTNICTGANVMIQREEKEYAECGRSLTLTCKIQKYVFAMSWLTGKDQIKIARCVENTCDQNPNYFGQYNFTFDVERGVFNLTIVKVTKDDNGRILVCSDGSDVDTRVIKISAFEPMLLEDPGTGKVMATSGCVSNVTDVSFKWIKISTINGIEEDFIPTINSNYSSICSYESACWIDEQMQYNVTIEASASQNHGQYYLKIVAIYGHEQKESSNSTYMYIIDEDDKKDQDRYTNRLPIIIIIVVSACLTILLSLAITCRCRIKCKNRNEMLYHIILKRSEPTSRGDGNWDIPHAGTEENLQLANWRSLRAKHFRRKQDIEKDLYSDKNVC